MIKLLDQSKIPLFDYLYLFTVIVYSGLASALVRGFGDIRTLGNAILLFLTIVFAIYKRIAVKKDFIIVISVFVLYSILTIITTGAANTFLWLFSKWIIYLFTTYVVCQGFKYRFFIISETILYHLALIAIIGWLLLLLVPGAFINFASGIALPAFNDDPMFTSFNFWVYTIIPASVLDGAGEFYSLIRNSGFAWEPGAFACFMCLAICFNAIRTKFSLKSNFALYVFVAALLTTQSTTGYSIFCVMLMLWLIANKRFSLLLLSLPLIPVVLDLPFMGEKLMLKSEDFSYATLSGSNAGESFDRFLSFRILWDEFLRYPLFGYGYSESMIEKLDMQTWSGIGRLLAQYGACMAFLFFYLLIKSAHDLNKYFCSKAGVMIIVTFVGMMVSYMLWMQPFWIAVWMSCVFMQSPKSGFYKV